jgi:hypothetical protein
MQRTALALCGLALLLALTPPLRSAEPDRRPAGPAADPQRTRLGPFR